MRCREDDFDKVGVSWRDQIGHVIQTRETLTCQNGKMSSDDVPGNWGHSFVDKIIK